MSEPLEHQTESYRNWLGRNYDRAAWFYEKSARLYSGDQIAASKLHQLNYIQHNDKVIFLGVGTGEDAIAAAKHGADVTCIDISSGMLASLQRKLDSEKLNARLVCQSAYEFDEFESFDAVCANYFLNMFKLPDMVRMLNHTCKLVKPGGKFMIADVALPQGNAFHRAINMAYRKFAMTSFWILGLVPLHKDHDYLAHLNAADISVQEIEFFQLYRNGPVVYQCIVGQRQS